MVPPFPNLLVRNRSKVDLIDERWFERDQRQPPGSMLGPRVDVALGVLLGLTLAASLAAGWRLVRAPRVQDPSSSAMQSAVHATTSLLPHLRRGLGAGSAPPAAPHLRMLTGASAVALADTEQLLAFDGAGSGHHRPGDPLAGLAGEVRDDRVRVEPRLQCEAPGCPLRSAIVAPLVVRDRRVGALVALYDRPGRLRLEETRVVGRGRRAGVGDGRAVGDGGAGRAARARRAAGAARADLPALHLQRAGGGRLVHPLAPGGGARAADRVRRVHPLRVRAPARVRHASPTSCATWRSTCGSSRRASGTG